MVSSGLVLIGGRGVPISEVIGEHLVYRLDGQDMGPIMEVGEEGSVHVGDNGGRVDPRGLKLYTVDDSRYLEPAPA